MLSKNKLCQGAMTLGLLTNPLFADRIENFEQIWDSLEPFEGDWQLTDCEAEREFKARLPIQRKAFKVIINRAFYPNQPDLYEKQAPTLRVGSGEDGKQIMFVKMGRESRKATTSFFDYCTKVEEDVTLYENLISYKSVTKIYPYTCAIPIHETLKSEIKLSIVDENSFSFEKKIGDNSAKRCQYQRL